MQKESNKAPVDKLEDYNVAVLKTCCQSNSFPKFIFVVCNSFIWRFGNRCLFDTKLWFCQLQANSSLTLSFSRLKDLRRVNDNIKFTEPDRRETAPLNSVANYLFSIFEVRFVLAQLLTKHDRCWIDEKYGYKLLPYLLQPGKWTWAIINQRESCIL